MDLQMNLANCGSSSAIKIGNSYKNEGKTLALFQQCAIAFIVQPIYQLTTKKIRWFCFSFNPNQLGWFAMRSKNLR